MMKALENVEETAKQAAEIPQGSGDVKVEGLRLGRLEAGMFQLIVDPYDEVVNQVQGRCSEAQEQMQGTADAFTSEADTYDAEETANEHRLKNIY